MNRFERDGVSLAYEASGSGTPIVMLHGLSMSTATWSRFVPELEQNSRVVRLDQRGHGGSDHAGGYVLDNYVADTVAFLTEVVGEPCVLVGHSLGGVIAHAVVASAPELVLSTLLEDPPLYVADRMQAGMTRGEASSVGAMFPLMQQLCRDMQGRNAPVDEWIAVLGGVPSLNGNGTMADVVGTVGIRSMAESFVSLDPEIFTPAIDGSAIAGAFDRDATLACPAVVVRADPKLGPAFTEADETRFLTANPHGRVVAVEGASHQLHDEQPERFLYELHALLG